jgi:hypothetical protein
MPKERNVQNQYNERYTLVNGFGAHLKVPSNKTSFDFLDVSNAKPENYIITLSISYKPLSIIKNFL